VLCIQKIAFMKIHKQTIKILKKVLNFDLKTEKLLNKNILDYCDSLKFLEILIEIEKTLKKKIVNKSIKKFADLNRLFIK
jgi:acyl carrier protein